MCILLSDFVCAVALCIEACLPKTWFRVQYYFGQVCFSINLQINKRYVYMKLRMHVCMHACICLGVSMYMILVCLWLRFFYYSLFSRIELPLIAAYLSQTRNGDTLSFRTDTVISILKVRKLGIIFLSLHVKPCNFYSKLVNRWCLVSIGIYLCQTSVLLIANTLRITD